MVSTAKNMCKTVVPKDSKELHLPVRNGSSSVLFKADIIAGGVSSLKKGYHIIRVGHEFNLIVFCTAGLGTLITKEGKRDFKPGMMLINPAGVYAEYLTRKNSFDILWLHLKDSYKWRNLKKKDDTIKSSQYSDRLKNAMYNYYIEASSKEKNNGLAMDLQARLILLYLERDLADYTDSSRFSGIWEKVSGELSKGWSVESLAELAGISPVRFAHACKETYNISPMKYVTKLRMESAKQILMSTDYKLETVANMLGYADAFIFSTVFKKMTGMSPKGYRIENKR